MPARNEKTIIGTFNGIFEDIQRERNIIVDGASLYPLDTDSPDKYIILAGTPLCPIVSTGRYKPISRTWAAAAVNNDTALTVDDATPFVGHDGEGIRYYTALTATSALVTISSVSEADNVITLTAAATVADNAVVELALNGAHGNADAANSTQIPDAVILKHDVQVAFDDSATFHVPATGVIMGTIRRDRVKWTTATFDQRLKDQLPNISFLPTAAGTA